MAIGRRRKIGAPDPQQLGDSDYQSLTVKSDARMRAHRLANTGDYSPTQRMAISSEWRNQTAGLYKPGTSQLAPDPDLSREQLHYLPGNREAVIGPTMEEAARQYEQALLGRELEFSSSRRAPSGRTPVWSGTVMREAQSPFSVQIRGNFNPMDEGIERFRQHLSEGAVALYNERTRRFDNALAEAMTAQQGRIGSLDDFDRMIQGVDGYDDLIGAHARTRGRALLERMDPDLAFQLQMQGRLKQANDQAFENWLATRDGYTAGGEGPEADLLREDARRQWQRDPEAERYRFNPATQQIEQVPLTAEQQREIEFRDMRDRAMQQEQLQQEMDQREQARQLSILRQQQALIDQQYRSRGLEPPPSTIMQSPDGSYSLQDLSVGIERQTQRKRESEMERRSDNPRWRGMTPDQRQQHLDTASAMLDGMDPRSFVRFRPEIDTSDPSVDPVLANADAQFDYRMQGAEMLENVGLSAAFPVLPKPSEILQMLPTERNNLLEQVAGAVQAEQDPQVKRLLEFWHSTASDVLEYSTRGGRR